MVAGLVVTDSGIAGPGSVIRLRDDGLVVCAEEPVVTRAPTPHIDDFLRRIIVATDGPPAAEPLLLLEPSEAFAP